MKRALVCALMLLPTAALAQHRPYAGQQEQEIKSLSPDEVKQYLSGAGMGYAKSAELNRFPGPMHVLELADKLELTPDQRARTKALMDAHKAEARTIGAKRVESERTIEALFRVSKLDEAALASGVREAAALEGEYRLSHLETHRRMRTLLSEEQVAHYAHLRGYETVAPSHGSKHWK
ncbi:MAG: Spy/CpxP family protein refolding chaperone [Betaproteobacteria bacterium]